ncbi:MAG: AbrB/MazE/SpoVT family DNA-binding domain-containing protein [Rubrobacter sp.]|jgi:AbrB family looped-hinge helix DNA binding protein|nr:AbrB/MazE/SpoVT family DNA-binding domain-containing protein [Rubrobacter sp.]MBA3950254.1 AbrB/MazE/SpoVT family DNA-binding domain-containing protein [Rubrobacter sp.]MDQ3360249.1 AbrB/MazE/SpoVT family DNA-binding domain-containing protein [Actinomycetota bacterium]MDQ3377181.1 AbrB/MazE/SpoVT family DNA-binding domain-containing protein [Actinomycetota bacterium]
MDGSSEQARVNVGPQGRVVIPARIRRSLSIGPGDTLVVRVVEGRIVLEKRADVLARVRGRFEGVRKGVSLADELILERREEASRESAG